MEEFEGMNTFMHVLAQVRYLGSFVVGKRFVFRAVETPCQLRPLHA